MLTTHSDQAVRRFDGSAREPVEEAAKKNNRTGMAHTSTSRDDGLSHQEGGGLALGFGGAGPLPASAQAEARGGDRGAVPLRPEHSASASPTSEARLTSVRYFNGNVHRITALVLCEAAITFIAFYAAALFRFPGETVAGLEGVIGPMWPRALLVAAVMLASLASMGLYQLRNRARFTGVLARVVVAVCAAQAALGLLFYLVPSLFVGRGVLLIAGGLCLGGFATARLAFGQLVDQDVFKRRVLVWGAGERAATIGVRLRRRTDQRGFRVVGYVSAPGDRVQVAGSQILSPERDLLDFVLREKVQEIVIAMDDRRQGFPEAFLRECRLRGICVCDVLHFLERETGRVSVEFASPSWLIYSKGFRADIVRLALKRAFDIAASLALIVATAPVMLLAALAILAEDRGPILYRQVRTGQGGRPFRILKFRSMSVNAESGGKAVWAVRDDPRVTRVGAFIRKVRIDELPQAFNVLVGEMSFVGPRPERPEFVQSLQRTIPYYAERHFAKPGITGWAQVRYPYGASEHDAREKLGYDLYYVMNHSLVFDVMILLQTVEIVLFRIGSR